MLTNAPASIDYLFRNHVSGGRGGVAETLLANDFNPDALRPYIGRDGRTYTTKMVMNKDTGILEPKALVMNTITGTLRKDQWDILDEVVVKTAKPRLRLIGDLRGNGLSYSIPDGMSKTVLQYQAQSDITGATISMDGMRQNESDRPIYDLVNLPLPIIHKDFSYPARELMVSRANGNPLDTSTAELATRRVAETAEQLLSGTGSTYAYGGGTIYGYTNFPNRVTLAMTAPTATGYTPITTLNEVLQMKLLSQQAYHFGPWKLYTSLAWEPYLDNDYKALGGMTLRQRLALIDNIQGVVTADYLNTTGGYTMVLVQQSSDVVRAVIGMEIVVVQWESHGGMQVNFKVMCIIVPQIRADHAGNTGLVHGSA